MSPDKWEEGDRWAWDWEQNRPLGPIVASILVVIGWLVFILLYALFWSSGFTLFQNVIVTVVSLVIMALLIGLGWVVWGMRHAWPRRKTEQPTATPG
jgi:high-affinity Fe2+/Pb2+ permease